MMKRVGKFSLFVILLSQASGARAQTYDQDVSKIKVFEKQFEVACSNTHQSRLDPLRSVLVTRLIDRAGPAQMLMKDLTKRGAQASLIVETPQNSQAMKSFSENERIAARENLEARVKQLDLSVRNRSPASAVDRLREEVKKEYQNFKLVSDPVSPSPTAIAESERVRGQKLKEVEALAQLSGRLHETLSKAYLCGCKTESGEDDCKAKETLDEEKQWYNASSSHLEAQISQRGARKQVSASVGH